MLSSGTRRKVALASALSAGCALTSVLHGRLAQALASTWGLEDGPPLAGTLKI